LAAELLALDVHVRQQPVEPAKASPKPISRTSVSGDRMKLEKTAMRRS
jgi:hypothetical protein